MTDQLAGSAGGAASLAPGSVSADIETIKAQLRQELEAQFEERIKGFQRIIGSKDERLTAFEKELKQLKTASLSPEELEELELQEKDRRIAELEARIEMQQLAGQYGDEMPYFERLLQASTAEEQLKALREYREAFAAASTQPPAPPAGNGELEVPDVDLNRPPARRPSGAVLPNGTVMTDDLADQILGSVGRQALASFTQHRRG